MDVVLLVAGDRERFVGESLFVTDDTVAFLVTDYLYVGFVRGVSGLEDVFEGTAADLVEVLLETQGTLVSQEGNLLNRVDVIHLGE